MPERFFNESTKTFDVYQYGSNGNAHVHLGTALAGEEQSDSEANSKLRVTEDWKYFRMAASTATQTIYNGPCRCGGVMVDAGVSPGAITLLDDTTTVHISASGSSDAAKGVRFVTSLRAAAGTTGAGVAIKYREAEFPT